MRARPDWFALSVASIAAVGTAGAIGGTSPVRTLFVAWFLLTCPGMAMARLIDLDGAFEELSVGIGISIAINTLLALVLVYLGLWSPWAVFALVAVLTIGAVAAGLAQRAREAA